MQSGSRLHFRHDRLASHTNAIVVIAAIVMVVSLLGAAGLMADLLLLESEPLIAAPLRW